MTADRDDLAAILAEAIAKAEYETVGHDLDKYPWDDDTANQGHKERYREMGERLSAHVAQMVLESDWLRGVRVKELRDAADGTNLHRQVPKDREDLDGFCQDDDCLWWDMTYALQDELRDRADRVDAEDGEN